ncbi:MAG: hypothetical protein M3O70_15665 [Actinomycetota bacterium]|nr:hypothetical protein [Actinomycetota bacterium]
MASIEVVPIGSGEFQVEVHDDAGQSTHRVVVPESYMERLGVENASMQDLVRESFRFLLEREPKESIQAEFELPTIGDYFPEYPEEIKERVGGGQ